MLKLGSYMKTTKIVGLGVAILFVAVWLAPFCSFAHEGSKPSKNLQLAKHSAKNDLLVRKIQTLLRAKRTRDRALALAKKAVSDYPDSGEFHKLLAEAYSYSEENQLSKKHFRLALNFPFLFFIYFLFKNGMNIMYYCQKQWFVQSIY